MTFKTNDVVRIVKQPPNQNVQIKNEFGFIEELQTLDGIDYALIRTLKLYDAWPRCEGSGWVPVDCIVLESNQECINHKVRYDKEREKYLKESLAYSNHQKSLKQKFIDETTKKFGLTSEQINSVFEYYCEFKRKQGLNGW